MPNNDIRTQQNTHFDELYNALFSFYQAALQKADQPHKKVRLQLTTEFFDDLELLKIVQSIFAKGLSNPAERRAVARQAYADALQIHNNGAQYKWVTVDDKKIAKGEAKGTY